MSAAAAPRTGVPGLAEAARELETRRSRNLEVMRQVMPDGWERFRDYQPARLVLRWDPDVGPVVQGARSGLSVYPVAPREYAREQVEEWLEAPEFRTARFASQEILQIERTVHNRLMNRAIDTLNAVPSDPVRLDPAFTSCLVVYGLGLGYHVNDLLESLDIRHLCIVEPDEDLFHAALHTVELLDWVEHFARPGYSLELVIGRSPGQAVHQMCAWLDEVGGHNVVQPYLFRHRSGDTLSETADRFDYLVRPNYVSFLGYFDDEREGLAHSMANVAADLPLLVRTQPRDQPGHDRPAWVVANGPSLDESIEVLREHRDGVVLISCGTALGSLVKAGLIPDIHVELERTRPISEWIQQATTQEIRDQIHLVAINTVHPDVFALFPHRTMAAKAFDLGAAWMDARLIPGGPIPRVLDCGPTVGNCGLSVAAALGFTDVTVFGMDLGYPRGRQHHSSLSVHYDIVEEEQDSVIHDYDDPMNQLAPANFGGEVRTTPIYLQAARAVQSLTEFFPHLTIRNPARGLRIPGTVPVALEEVSAGSSFDTRRWAHRLLRERSAAGLLRPARTPDRAAVTQALGSLAEELEHLVDVPVRDRNEAMVQLMMTQLHLRDRSTDPDLAVPAGMLTGSVGQFCLVLSAALHRVRDEDRALELFGACREIFTAFLGEVRRRVARRDFFVLDDRTHELSRKIGAA